MKVKYRGHNGYDTKQASEESSTHGGPIEKMTSQQWNEDADINVIMKRYGVTGQLPVGKAQAIWGQDWSQVGSYGDALMALKEATDNFMELPPNVRARFQNDPGKLLEFVQDDENWDEAVKLGIANPRPVKTESKEETPPKGETKSLT